MSGGGTQNSLRKTLGALKDSTTVNLAKINSDYKDLDIAIVKATNHEEKPAKERHIRAVLASVSATRPRADVSYCIHALARRLSKTHNWAVALKTLIMIHRALREVDPSFHEELVNYGRSMSHMLNMAHFKDDSSPDAWDYSSWVRSYALFLEERLECFRVLKYDLETDQLTMKDLDTPNLLEHLPALQQLLYRVLSCQPQGAATRNMIIQLALSLVSSESIKIYNAITDGNVNLVDKFFEMKSSDARKALDIYRRAATQAERLSDFYEMIRNIDVGSGERSIKIEQPPASFLQAMEEYVREAPRTSTARKDLFTDTKPKEILALEDKKSSEEKEVVQPSPPTPDPKPENEPQVVIFEPIMVETSAPDLLGVKEPSPAALELDEKNAMALAIVPIEQPSLLQPNLAPGATGWELALVSAQTGNETTATTTTTMVGGLDKLTLDSLYDDAIRRNNQNSNPWDQASMGNIFAPQTTHPFYGSNATVAPISYNQNGFQPPQMMMMNQKATANPFAAPVYGYNPYPNYI